MNGFTFECTIWCDVCCEWKQWPVRTAAACSRAARANGWDVPKISKRAKGEPIRCPTCVKEKRYGCSESVDE